MSLSTSGWMARQSVRHALLRYSGGRPRRSTRYGSPVYDFRKRSRLGTFWEYRPARMLKMPPSELMIAMRSLFSTIKPARASGVTSSAISRGGVGTTKFTSCSFRLVASFRRPFRSCMS